MVLSIQGDFVSASWAIIAAAVFDMLDGRIARLAKATSQFGVEYDSLSDLISFGMAPAILMLRWTLEPYGRLGWLAAFLYLACAALRLARFNSNIAIVPKGFFQGLPSPAAAGVMCTFVIFQTAVGIPTDTAEVFSKSHIAIGQTFLIASLMVSTIRFPSFKELNWKSRATFGYLMVGVLTMILIAVRPEVTIFLTLATYVGFSLLWNLYRLIRGEAPAAATAQAKDHQA